jgi:DNA-binding transcriptional LysR family regulator
MSGVSMSKAADPRPAAHLPAPRAEVDELRAFVAVARTGSVGRAAEVLARTQPTISARLASLERVWGTRLFRRMARGMALTPEGSRLLPLAEAALRDLEELDRAAGLPIAVAGELRIGAGDALGRERLPRALAALQRKQPEAEIHLREGPGPVLLEALRRGEIDLALVVSPDDEETGNGVDLEPLIQSEIVLLVPRRARWRGIRSPVDLRALADDRLVSLQPGSGFRRHLEGAFVSAGIAYRPAVEVGNLSLVRRFVAAGLGVAPVPQIAFTGRGSARGVRKLDLTGVDPVIYQRAVRAGVPPPPVAQRLLDLLRS